MYPDSIPVIYLVPQYPPCPGRGTPRLPALPEEHRAEAVWRQSAAGNGSIVGMLEIYWIYIYVYIYALSLNIPKYTIHRFIG